MSDSTWRDQIISAAKNWPRGFRAHLDTGVWRLLGANEAVQQEFRLCAQRLWRELRLPRGATDAVSGLLYRLKENGHHVWSSSRTKKYRAGSANITANRTRVSIYPLRSALIKFLSQLPGPDTKPASRVQALDSGQAAAVERNRERQARAMIIRALQMLGAAYSTQWPDFVREFYTNGSAQTEYRQPVSATPFQPPAFDRLNQSPKDWVKTADAAWQQHRDEFLQARQFWVTAGVDEEIPAAKGMRGAKTAVGSKRGENTAKERRYVWVGKYLAGVPVKEIAAQDDADPSTVGRIARGILRQANWLKPATATRRKRSRRD